MSSEKPSLPSPGQRQRVRLGSLAAVLVVCAFIAAFALTKLPRPARIFISLSDLGLAAALLLLMRKDPVRRH
jgi:hypothetical protein